MKYVVLVAVKFLVAPGPQRVFRHQLAPKKFDYPVIGKFRCKTQYSKYGKDKENDL